jgi:hypothetical protein
MCYAKRLPHAEFERFAEQQIEEWIVEVLSSMVPGLVVEDARDGHA